MRHLPTALLLAVAGALPALAAAEATTQILQQRTRDGSILLTDHAAPGAATERSWQVRAEDPAAARQRAIDVKAEANLVTERIQRSIESQQRADDEAQRLRLASFQLEHDRSAMPDGVSYGYAGGSGWATPFRASRFPGPRVGDVGIIDLTGTRGMDGRHRGHRGGGRHGGPGKP